MTADMLVAVGGFAVCLSKFGSIFMEIEAERNINAFVARGVSEAMIEFAPRPHPALRAGRASVSTSLLPTRRA